MYNGYLLLLLVLPLIATAFRIGVFAMVDGGVRASLRQCAIDQLKAVGVFGLLGPPMGVLSLMVVGVLQKGELLHLLFVVPAMLFAFPVGALPAAATGAIVGALKPWLSGWYALAASCFLGGVQTALWLLAISLADQWKGVVSFSLAGAFAALVCARILFGAPGKAKR